MGYTVSPHKPLRMPIDFAIMTVSFKVTVVKFAFLMMTKKKTFRANNMILGTDTCLGSGQMPIAFGVALFIYWDH